LNSAIAIDLDSIAGGIVGVIVSTALIVIFGEILPMAIVCKNALLIGSYCV